MEGGLNLGEDLALKPTGVEGLGRKTSGSVLSHREGKEERRDLSASPACFSKSLISPRSLRVTGTQRAALGLGFRDF